MKIVERLLIRRIENRIGRRIDKLIDLGIEVVEEFVEKKRGFNKGTYVDLLAALKSLGYSKAQSEMMAKKVMDEHPDASLEELVKLCFKEAAG
jgi:Holliday junction resolvasome RuvABC DNA-binding subunit